MLNAIETNVERGKRQSSRMICSDTSKMNTRYIVVQIVGNLCFQAVANNVFQLINPDAGFGAFDTTETQ